MQWGTRGKCVCICVQDWSRKLGSRILIMRPRMARREELDAMKEGRKGSNMKWTQMKEKKERKKAKNGKQRKSRDWFIMKDRCQPRIGGWQQQKMKWYLAQSTSQSKAAFVSKRRAGITQWSGMDGTREVVPQLHNNHHREWKKKKSPLPKKARYGLDQLRDVVFFLPSSIVHSLPSFPFFLPFLSSFLVSFFFSRRINANVCAFLLSSWAVTNKDAQSNYGGWINMNERTLRKYRRQTKKIQHTTHTTIPHHPSRNKVFKGVYALSLCGCRFYDRIVWIFECCTHNFCGCPRILTF